MVVTSNYLLLLVIIITEMSRAWAQGVSLHVADHMGIIWVESYSYKSERRLFTETIGVCRCAVSASEKGYFVESIRIRWKPKLVRLNPSNTRRRRDVTVLPTRPNWFGWSESGNHVGWASHWRRLDLYRRFRDVASRPVEVHGLWSSYEQLEHFYIKL